MKQPIQIWNLGSRLMRFLRIRRGVHMATPRPTTAGQPQIAQWCKTQRQPWYLLLNPTGVDSQAFLEHVLPPAAEGAARYSPEKGRSHTGSVSRHWSSTSRSLWGQKPIWRRKGSSLIQATASFINNYVGID